MYYSNPVFNYSTQSTSLKNLFAFEIVSMYNHIRWLFTVHTNILLFEYNTDCSNKKLNILFDIKSLSRKKGN